MRKVEDNNKITHNMEKNEDVCIINMDRGCLLQRHDIMVIAYAHAHKTAIG